MLATHIQHQNSQTLYFEVGTLIFGNDGHVLTFQNAKIATTWTSNHFKVVTSMFVKFNLKATITFESLKCFLLMIIIVELQHFLMPLKKLLFNSKSESRKFK